MSQTARISHQQLGAVVVVFSQVATLLYLPAPLAEVAGPDAWMAVPLGILAGAVPVAYLLSRLAIFHPRRTLGEIAEFCLGRWLGKLVTLTFAGYSLFLASLVLRNVLDFSVVTILPGTPMWVMGALFILSAAYGVYCGVEVVTRLAVLIALTACLSVGFIPIGVSPEMEVMRILPFLGNGITPVMRAAWMITGWFAELWIFGAWIGLVDKPRQLFKGFLWGLLGAGFLLTTLVVSTLVTFGADLTRRLTFPSYSLVQEISIAEILERMELVLLTIWLAGMFIKVSVCMWSATTASATTFGLKTDRWLILPVAGLIVALALLWPGIVYLMNFGAHMWTPLTLPFTMGVPALLTAVSWWRLHRTRGHAA